MASGVPPRRVYGERDGGQRNPSALPAPTNARLASNVLSARSLQSITPKQGAGPVDGSVVGTDVRARLAQLWTVNSMNAIQGSKLLVEPFLTWQDDNGAAGTWYDDTGLRFSWDSSPTVRWWLTPERRLIVLGSAVHLPAGNATHFPVFATMQM